MVTFRRRSYTRSDGTRVRSALVHTSGSGKSRGRKTGGPFKGGRSWITRQGKLGGSGFLKKSASTQHKLLDKCVRHYGYRSCLGSIMVLQRSKRIREKYDKKLDSLKAYLKKHYGGFGSFKKRSLRKSKRKPRRK